MLALATFLALGCQFALLDLALRGARAFDEQPRSWVGLVETGVVWSLALSLARSRGSRIAIAALASALFVTQSFVFRYYHAPVDVQLVQSAWHAMNDVRPVLRRVMPSLLAVTLVLGVVEYMMATFAINVLFGVMSAPSARASATLLCAASLAGLFGPAPRYATPDVRLVDGLVRLPAFARKGRRAPGAATSLPPLVSERRALPNILFVLTESVRASDYVTLGAEATAAATARVTPGRVDLHELRAVSSYTAVALSSVLSGRSQEGDRDAIVRAPALFDFARAVQDERRRRPFVGYFSAQSETVFEAKDVRASMDRFVTVETLRGKDVADDAEYIDLPLDRDIVDHFVRALPELPTPAVLMLHLVGTHAPYFVDANDAPFEPYDHTVTWAGMPRLHNAYRDAIVAQDKHVARAVRAFVEHAGTEPWLIVFTSDHGEAFGEHGAIHHGQNLLDEQVHVPGFVAHGNGALDGEALAALSDHGRRFVTHLDLLPTMLDALGVWDSSAVSTPRASMRGRSLLRPWEPRGPIPVTNCTGMFPCPVNTWGVFDDDHAVVARLWDASWTCIDRRRALDQVATPDDATCARLQSASRSFFPTLPNGAVNR